MLLISQFPGWVQQRLGLVLMVGLAWILVFSGVCAGAERAGSGGGTDRVGVVAASPDQASAMVPVDSKRKLAAGDRIGFRVVEDREEPKLMVVADSGVVDVPLVGKVQAEGKTLSALSEEIRKSLETTYYYKATVVLSLEMFSRNRGRVYVAGQVRIPGPVELPADETLTVGKAILRSGGFGEFADKRRVRVTRARGGVGVTPVVVNVLEIWESGRIDKDLELEAGDFIFVESKSVGF